MVLRVSHSCGAHCRVAWEEAGTPELLLCISNELLHDIKERQFVEPVLLKICPYVRSKRKPA